MSIVITGSTRGIGFGLADSFLQRGQQVVISGRSQASVDNALKQLSEKYGDNRVHGFPCEVSDIEQNQALWESAASRFGNIHIWINNAGINQPRKMIWEVSPEHMKALVDVNILGVMYGSRVAMQGMIAQGRGHIYNMEGSGSGGEIREGVSIYGATKYALSYFTKALRKEAADTPVKISTISPGIVMTDLIFDAYQENPSGIDNARRIFNILGDKVETVTPWLADRVLANDKNGVRIAWLSTTKIMYRFMTAGINKRDMFAE